MKAIFYLMLFFISSTFAAFAAPFWLKRMQSSDAGPPLRIDEPETKNYAASQYFTKVYKDRMGAPRMVIGVPKGQLENILDLAYTYHHGIKNWDVRKMKKYFYEILLDDDPRTKEVLFWKLQDLSQFFHALKVKLGPALDQADKVKGYHTSFKIDLFFEETFSLMPFRSILKKIDKEEHGISEMFQDFFRGMSEINERTRGEKTPIADDLNIFKCKYCKSPIKLTFDRKQATDNVKSSYKEMKEKN